MIVERFVNDVSVCQQCGELPTVFEDECGWSIVCWHYDRMRGVLNHESADVAAETWNAMNPTP
jgi:hypothetical protein